jgi:hypothetical protein
MSFLRTALPALAIAGSAYAASCSTSGTATIQNGGDATSIAACTTYSGSIAVATGVTDVSLDGNLKSIDGNVVIESNSDVQRFGSLSLKSISGKLTLNDVSQLAALSFPQLTEVDELTLTGLPNLRALEFTKGITKANKLDIENTKLQNLNGIDLEEVGSIFIANNDDINSIEMQVTHITEFITLSFNNAEVNVSFPKLESANNISFRAIGSLNIPALAKINSGSFGVFESDKLESISAPNLTKIDGALVLNDNKGLKNMSFASLTDVGANLQIANNTNLHQIDGLPKLKNVDAALDMSGNFSKVATPSLDFVKGVFNLQSEGDIGTVCKDFYEPLKSKKKLQKGGYECKGDLEEANTANIKPKEGSGGKNNDEEGAAVGFTVPSVSLGLVGLVAVLLL